MSIEDVPGGFWFWSRQDWFICKALCEIYVELFIVNLTYDFFGSGPILQPCENTPAGDSRLIWRNNEMVASLTNFILNSLN